MSRAPPAESTARLIEPSLGLFVESGLRAGFAESVGGDAEEDDGDALEDDDSGKVLDRLTLYLKLTVEDRTPPSVAVPMSTLSLDPSTLAPSLL